MAPAGTTLVVMAVNGPVRSTPRFWTVSPAYGSGDRLHPNDAGCRAMAEAVDLALLRPTTHG